MGLKAWALANTPPRYHLPLRYWYRFLTHRLEKEWSIVRPLIRRGGVAVDIGANHGIYTYALARLGMRVEAFEPIPACARTIAAFGAANVRVHEVALSSGNGARELFVPRERDLVHTALASFTRPVSPHDVVMVPVRPLDAFGFTDVAFIKIDVEGHEAGVLAGARDTIASNHPVLLVEIEQRHLTTPMQAVFDVITGLGYRGSFVADGAVRPLTAFRYEIHQQPFVHDVMSPRYVNNFIFVPESTS